ncbi:MAG: EF-P lysine aminoacylase GenX [Rhodospirillaceae bacterium]|nr:EF-P lysine aminoacylase GenX [Rhodospirillaceae bacterium]
MIGKEWWQSDEFSLRLPILLARARIILAIRDFFNKYEFIEVETPYLQRYPSLEPHIMSLSTELNEPFGTSSQRLYLHTSPEFSMKKLLVAGMKRIFQFAHVWRDGERSPIHHPEFTMLEWYRVGEKYNVLMEDCIEILSIAARVASVKELRHKNKCCDPFAEPKYLTVAQAFFDYCGIDLLASTNDPKNPNAKILIKAAQSCGLNIKETDSWHDVFFSIMLEYIEPHLGNDVPLILYNYPAPLASLSRLCPDNNMTSERFELYVCGIELANGFGELTDATEQRRRFNEDVNLKEQLYGLRYPIDEDFLNALETKLPDCSGIAFGIDRLIMLVTGTKTIENVLWAPI